MSKTRWITVVAILAGVSLTVLGCGQDSSQPSKTTEVAKPKVADPMPPPLTGLPREAFGEVVKADPAMKTLVVMPTGTEKKEMTFTVKETAAGNLAEFKPGDKVMVKFYVETDGKLTAESITKA